jgi:alkylation response protein AidB-like acyl-CoA dehydrogenase
MDQSDQAIMDSSVVKYLCANTLWDIAYDTVQVYGGNGSSEDKPFIQTQEESMRL